MNMSVVSLQLAKMGKVTDSEARLYLHASEEGRAFLEKYYNLQTPLYFHYTHLVCRKAIESMKHERSSNISYNAFVSIM